MTSSDLNHCDVWYSVNYQLERGEWLMVERVYVESEESAYSDRQGACT